MGDKTTGHLPPTLYKEHDDAYFLTAQCTLFSIQQWQLHAAPCQMDFSLFFGQIFTNVFFLWQGRRLVAAAVNHSCRPVQWIQLRKGEPCASLPLHGRLLLCNPIATRCNLNYLISSQMLALGSKLYLLLQCVSYVFEPRRTREQHPTKGRCDEVKIFFFMISGMIFLYVIIPFYQKYYEK